MVALIFSQCLKKVQPIDRFIVRNSHNVYVRSRPNSHIYQENAEVNVNAVVIENNRWWQLFMLQEKKQQQFINYECGFLLFLLKKKEPMIKQTEEMDVNGQRDRSRWADVSYTGFKKQQKMKTTAKNVTKLSSNIKLNIHTARLLH